MHLSNQVNAIALRDQLRYSGCLPSIRIIDGKLTSILQQKCVTIYVKINDGLSQARWNGET